MDTVLMEAQSKVGLCRGVDAEGGGSPLPLQDHRVFKTVSEKINPRLPNYACGFVRYPDLYPQRY